MEADGSRFTVCPLCPLGYLPRKSTSCAVAVLFSHSLPLLKLAGRMEKPASRVAPCLGQAPRIVHNNKPDPPWWGDDCCATRKGDPAPPLPQPISETTQHVRQGKTFGKTSENRISCAKLICEFRDGGRSNNAYDVCVIYECLRMLQSPGSRHRGEESENINTGENSRRTHQDFATPTSTNGSL